MALQQTGGQPCSLGPALRMCVSSALKNDLPGRTSYNGIPLGEAGLTLRCSVKADHRRSFAQNLRPRLRPMQSTRCLLLFCCMILGKLWMQRQGASFWLIFSDIFDASTIFFFPSWITHHVEESKFWTLQNQRGWLSVSWVHCLWTRSSWCMRLLKSGKLNLHVSLCNGREVRRLDMMPGACFSSGKVFLGGRIVSLWWVFLPVLIYLDTWCHYHPWLVAAARTIWTSWRIKLRWSETLAWSGPRWNKVKISRVSRVFQWMTVPGCSLLKRRGVGD